MNIRTSFRLSERAALLAPLLISPSNAFAQGGPNAPIKNVGAAPSCSHNVRRNPIRITPGFESIYAHGVEVPPGSRVLFVSGQIGVTSQGETLRGFGLQFEQAIDNLSLVLASSGMVPSDLVKLTFFVTRAEDLKELGEIRRRRLGVSPAVTTLAVAGLAHPDLLVEVEAVAASCVTPSA
jgi:2-iminobutanoate/2-iminopropanoate deaminase